MCRSTASRWFSSRRHRRGGGKKKGGSPRAASPPLLPGRAAHHTPDEHIHFVPHSQEHLPATFSSCQLLTFHRLGPGEVPLSAGVRHLQREFVELWRKNVKKKKRKSDWRSRFSRLETRALPLSLEMLKSGGRKGLSRMRG